MERREKKVGSSVKIHIWWATAEKEGLGQSQGAKSI